MAEKKFVPGDVFAVPLASGGCAFAVACCRNEFAFFNIRSENPNLPDRLLDFTLAFRVPVAMDAPQAARWRNVGNIQLPDAYLRPGRYLHRPVGSDQCFIYSDGAEVPAAFEECQDLEVLATWFSVHVEERLEALFAGRESQVVTGLRKQVGMGMR